MAMTKYEKQAKEYINPYRQEALKDKKKFYKNQEQDTRKLYDNQIFEAGRNYEDDYRENAVQKAINERQVAESMANMGLTDSGLNRTQQTAVQLSYANTKAGIDKQKRTAIDNLNLQKTSDLAGIRQNWLADKASINQTYDGYEADYAAKLEDAAAKKYAAYINNKSKDDPKGFILTNGATIDKSMQGTLNDNNITILPQKDADGDITGYKYVDNNTGKSTTVPIGVNPYTGDDNYVKYASVAATTDDFFENGYQPKKVYVNGVNYGYVQSAGDTSVINGNEQRVHKTVKDGKIKYWLWDRAQNEYIEVFVNKDGKWEEKVS